MAEPKRAPIKATQDIIVSLFNNNVDVHNPYLNIQQTDSIQFTNSVSGSTVTVNFIGSGNAVFNDMLSLAYPDTSPAESPNSDNVIANYTVIVTINTKTYVGGPFCVQVGTGPLPVELHEAGPKHWKSDPKNGVVPDTGATVQFINRDENDNCTVTFNGGFTPSTFTVNPDGGQQETTSTEQGVWYYTLSTPSAGGRVMTGGGTVGVGGTGEEEQGGKRER